jgi:predicted RNA-binding protein associated with RNAse of E/G family
MTPITVQKCNHRGEPVWQYEGDVVEQGATWVCLKARFARDDIDAGYVVFRRGDCMTEWFYSDRWYNVFRLEDVDDGHLKGWYCNIGRPARLGAGLVAYDDLALDVFVTPGGEVLVLDEDEFDALHLSEADTSASWAAVAAIRAAVVAHAFPFTLA